MTRPVAIGVGCRKSCPAATIEALIRQALGRFPECRPIGLYTVADKAGEVGLIEAAHNLGLPLTCLSREVLQASRDRVQTASARAERLFGVPAVAEAAALAGAGPDAVLIAPRIAAGGATCALAIRQAMTP